MEDMEIRSFSPEIEIRSAAKRLLCGIVVPYGINQRINETLIERFEKGVFRNLCRAAHRVLLRDGHSQVPGSVRIGKGVQFREDDAGLYAEFRVVEGNVGDHFLSLAREGVIREWSIGFRPDASRMDGRVTVHTKATMFETAIVEEGAYGERAAIEAVRRAKELPVLTRDTLLARLPKPHFPA